MAARAPSWVKRLYHAAMMLETGGHGIVSELPHGEIVRSLPPYRHMSWNPNEYAAFRAAIRRGDVAVDVGANVGAYSVLLGQWVGASGTVFAFEPAPSVFQGLVRHIHLNRVDKVVHPVAQAVGDCDGIAKMLIAGTAGESRVVSSADGVPVTAVPITRIDSFCVDQRIEPDFIKIDVEGSELAVLRGAREVIRAHGRSLALFVEMHPWIWPLLGIRKQDVVDELEAQSLEAVALPGIQTIWAVEGGCVQLRRR
jgi:FkbM family methyltransferase